MEILSEKNLGKYMGEWIVVSDQKVIAHNKSLSKLHDVIRKSKKCLTIARMPKDHSKKRSNHSKNRSIYKYTNIISIKMKPEEKIYNAYFESRKTSLYFNEMKEISGLSDSSLANTLQRLVKEGLLIQEKTKSNTYYKIKYKKIFGLKFSEIALQKFNKLNPNIKVPLKHFLEDIPHEVYTIVLFGSASRKKERKGSDIDILVVSEKKIDLSKNKKKAEITSKRPLSLFWATISQFMDNKDDVIIQARKTGFPIHKEQNFYNGY